MGFPCFWIWTSLVLFLILSVEGFPNGFLMLWDLTGAMMSNDCRSQGGRPWDRHEGGRGGLVGERCGHVSRA
jgi:hypothetical protein